MSDAKGYNQPLGGNEMPRFAGIATMMRLPLAASAAGLDVGFVGVPMDIGTSNRSGTRFGPRQIRSESVMLRPYNMATGAAPFERLRVADLGDIATNPYSLEKSVALIEAGIAAILAAGCAPLILGGDHTLAYPVLRAMVAQHGPVGLIHVDAHADVNDTMFGERIAHGTPFRRAVEDGAVNPARAVQIGLRGTGYAADDFDWQRARGFRVIQAEACWHRSLTPLMAEIRAQLGAGPVYLSFDIDSLDPSIAPGTGTPEIGGLTTIQALEIIRGCAGLDLVGADLVEVAPPYDMAGTTALIAANLLYEILCVMPTPKRHDPT
jgi:guanidinobutyrase